MSDGGSAQADLDLVAGELFDRDAVAAFVGEVVDGAREAGLNHLELYHAANSVRLAALAQIARQAASAGKAVSLGVDGAPELHDL